MTACIDASVWLATLDSSEVYHKQAIHFLKTLREGIVIPDLCLVEVAATLARKNISEELINKALIEIENAATNIVPVSTINTTAILLAKQLRLRGADALYVACAQYCSANLYTYDKEVIEKCSWAKIAE